MPPKQFKIASWALRSTSVSVSVVDFSVYDM